MAQKVPLKSSSTIVRIPGQTMTMNGVEYVLAPLNAGPLKQLLARFQDVHALSPIDMLDLAVDAAWFSLRRNYSEMTREYVEDELVDQSNMVDIIELTATASGLTQSDQGKTRPAKRSR